MLEKFVVPPVLWLMAVAPLNKVNPINVSVLTPQSQLAKTSILLDDDDGVIETLKFVMSTRLPLVVVKKSVLVVVTTCKTLNAPRNAFCCAAVKTSPATKVAGRVVGVAIVLS